MNNITIALLGGLGNQMFQYAFGFSLMEKYGVDVKYSTAYLSGGIKKYRLGIFGGMNVLLLEQESFKNRLTYRILNKLGNERLHSLFNYRIQQGMDLVDVKPKNNMKYIGYWQNEEYFKEFKGAIKSKFVLNVSLSDEYYAYLDKIENESTSVAVHFRKGDYLQHQDVYTQCSNNYYSNAIEYIESRTINAKYFVFSDDIESAKINWPGDSSRTVFVKNTKADYEDLFLMSKCNHNIIANSTFSWWGAYLGPENDRIICAPRKFFIKRQTFYPRQWITFEN